MNQKTTERRRDQRLDNNLPIRIFLDQGEAVTETTNISRSGVYCRVSQFIEPMTKLKVQLMLPVRKNGKVLSKKISCQGVVVRIEEFIDEQYNVAIFFNDITMRDADNIADYVRSYSDQQK